MPKTPSVDNAKKPWPKSRAWPVSILIVFVVVALIAYLYYVNGNLFARIIFSLVALVIAGEIILRINGFPRLAYGIYMARGKLGLDMMDRLASRHQRVWNFLADWGLVLGFGLFSLVLFRKDVSKKTIAFGTLSILLLLVFIIPYSLLPFSFINIPQITSRLPTITSPVPLISSFSPTAIALYALSALGGFVLYAIVSLTYNAFSILYGIGLALVTSLTSTTPNYTGISNSIPGVAPIIPGITIPLIAGILALALVLIVHEFSHGILSRIAKIKVKSSGLLVFGMIPIGAFVEPDEKKINKLGAKLQNRISSAGVAANMLFALITFVPMIILYFFIVPHFTQTYVIVANTIPNNSAYNVIAPGSTILRWNGYNVSTIAQAEAAAQYDLPNSNVSLVTNKGSFVLRANQDGKIGVYIEQGSAITGGALGGFAYFLYEVFSLSFLLNFLVAVVNYLPLPSLDGWRIFSVSIKNKRITWAITVFLIFVLVANVLPWFFGL